MGRNCALRWALIASICLTWGCGTPPKGSWFTRSAARNGELQRFPHIRAEEDDGPLQSTSPTGAPKLRQTAYYEESRWPDEHRYAPAREKDGQTYSRLPPDGQQPASQFVQFPRANGSPGSGGGRGLVRHDEQTQRLIEQELRDLAPEERRIWSRNLSRLDPHWVREVLRTRRLNKMRANSSWAEQTAGDRRTGRAVAAPPPATSATTPFTQAAYRADQFPPTSDSANGSGANYPAASSDLKGTGRRVAQTPNGDDPYRSDSAGRDAYYEANRPPKPGSVRNVPYSRMAPRQGGLAAPGPAALQPRAVPAGLADGTSVSRGPHSQPTPSQPGVLGNPQTDRPGAGLFRGSQKTRTVSKQDDGLKANRLSGGRTDPGREFLQTPPPNSVPAQFQDELRRLIAVGEAETARLRAGLLRAPHNTQAVAHAGNGLRTNHLSGGLAPGLTEAERQEYIEKHVSLHWLYLMAGEKAKALEAIPGLEPAEQEFWQQMFWAVASYFDSDALPDGRDRASQAVAQLRSAVGRLAENANLELKNVTFCHKISNFGNYDRFQRDEFSPGQPVLIYAELDNFKSEPTADGRYRTLLRSTVEIYKPGPDGGLVKREQFRPTEDLCRNRRHDYFHSYQIDIPQRITLGPHVLKLIVEDQLSRKVATYSLNFTVK